MGLGVVAEACACSMKIMRKMEFDLRFDLIGGPVTRLHQHPGPSDETRVGSHITRGEKRVSKRWRRVSTLEAMTVPVTRIDI